MKHNFSITESVKFGWHTMRAHSGLVFGVILTLFGVEIVHSVITNMFADTVAGALLSLALLVARAIIGVGMLVISLKLVRGQKAVYADIIPTSKIFWRYIGVNILICCIILVPMLVGFGACALLFFAPVMGVGQTFAAMLAVQSTPSLVFFALVIPTTIVVTMYLALRYALCSYFVVDGSTARQALKGSARATYGQKWHLIGFMFVCMGLYILGVIAILVGLLVAMPVVMLAYAHIYTQLKRVE